MQAQKSAPSKKASKPRRNGDAEEGNAGLNGQASSSYSSEDDSSASQDMNGGGGSSGSKSSAAATTNGKARAGRGSATDPQSLYARVRNQLPSDEQISKRGPIFLGFF